MKSAIFLSLAITITWCSNRNLPTTTDNEYGCSLKVQDLSPCTFKSSASTLEVMTWNIEKFPKDSSTLCQVSNIVDALQVDLIAVQEIDSNDDFNALIDNLEGWSGAYFDVRGGIESGYLYKESEFTAVSQLKSIFPDHRLEFPREPILFSATHKNGLEVTLINIHLKCCKDGEERRARASQLLKSYIDDSLSTEKVVVLGDFNDDILTGSPFDNFITDYENYTFADYEIAQGKEENWSYPSWPSHIDHILISSELNDNVISTTSIRLDQCIESYDASVSDHRPIVISLKKDEIY